MLAPLFQTVTIWDGEDPNAQHKWSQAREVQLNSLLIQGMINVGAGGCLRSGKSWLHKPGGPNRGWDDGNSDSRAGLEDGRDGDDW